MNILFNAIIFTALCLIGLCMIFLIYFTIIIMIEKRKYRKIPGPDHSGLKGFYLGQLPELIDGQKKRIYMPEILYENALKYGSTYKYRILNSTMIVTADPYLIKKVFVEENFPKSKQVYEKFFGFRYGERFGGYGLISECDNKKWSERRKIMNAAFHKKFLSNLIDKFDEKIECFTQRLNKLADGKTVISLSKEFRCIILDTLAKIGYNIDIDTFNNPDNELNKYINEIKTADDALQSDTFANLKPSKWHLLKNLKKAIRNLRNYSKTEILNRIKSFETNQTCINDIFTFILKSTITEDEGFDIELMIDEFLTFFYSAKDSIESVLTLFFLEIGKNTEIYEKLQSEIDTVFGMQKKIKFEDLYQLEYTDAIIKECLRLHPPLPHLSRTTEYDIKVNDFILPKGTWISTTSYITSRSEKYFSQPNEFMPERFLKSDNDKENSAVSIYTYFPFSLGPRDCIGKNFANIFNKLMISRLIQNFNFKIDPNQSFGYEFRLSWYPVDDTRFYLTPRKQ